ncbi:MAG TPA: hypothetical protein VK892_15470, partial [Pyrinomonadaceae bacterium]|nr:hypothetical protein [Pyrinomonadaceae bacterium]
MAALVGNEIELPPKDLSIKKPDILPEPKVKFPEKQEINKESAQQKNVTAEHWIPKTDSIDIPAQIIPETNASPHIIPNPDDSLKL